MTNFEKKAPTIEEDESGDVSASFSNKSAGSVKMPEGPPSSEGTSVVLFGAENKQENGDEKAATVPPHTALSLLKQLERRRQEREGETWDVEDGEYEERQLSNVAVPIVNLSSVGSVELSSSAISFLCPTIQAKSSIESQMAISVPYHPRYKRLIEAEEEEEIERLLRELSQEQQAVRELAAARRYQLMQEQLVFIQRQLGRENDKTPDLNWLLGDDADSSPELEEVRQAFAARDDDLPLEASEPPDVPLTCNNLFCRCPCKRDMRKDERALRWVLIFFPLGMPLVLGVFMSLCSIKKRQSVVKALAWLSCALFAIIFATFSVCLAVAFAEEISALGQKIVQETGTPDHDRGADIGRTNPYDAFTTTMCGPLGSRIKIEHASSKNGLSELVGTHQMKEEVFGTVVFIGLSRADTWDIVGLLDLAFEHDFDVLAITPPGRGNTTYLDDNGHGFWNPGIFLKTALESCLGISLARTVLVSHSNFVTRKFLLPLLFSNVALAFILFDSSVGTSWMDEYDPDVDDHKFYQVRTKHYRYVGNRRLAAVESILQALDRKYEVNRARTQLLDHPADKAGFTLEGAARRMLSATSLKGFCRAEPEGADDLFPTNTTIGPFDFFPGKYKEQGWNTARRRLREIPLDPPADEGMHTRLVSSEYFEPLRRALASLLQELKSLSLEGKLQVESLRPLRFNNRQDEYEKSREKTTKTNPRAIYCVESLQPVTIDFGAAADFGTSAILVDAEAYWKQRQRATSSTTSPPQTKIVASLGYTKSSTRFWGFALNRWAP
ncbi:hypothetical protein Efla_004561 [Eimeria flavescens]